MKAERFVRYLRQLKWEGVLKERDQGRVKELLGQALRDTNETVLVGFRVRGRRGRIVWVAIDVVPVGRITGREVPPDVPHSTEGYDAWDLRLRSFWFSQGPKRDVRNPDTIKPPELSDAPAILVPYPGWVSWAKLQDVARKFL